MRLASCHRAPLVSTPGMVGMCTLLRLQLLHVAVQATAVHQPLPADGMPWRFKPTQRSVKLHPGQSTLAFYTAHNRSDKAITGAHGPPGVPAEALCLRLWQSTVVECGPSCRRCCTRWWPRLQACPAQLGTSPMPLRACPAAGVSTYNVAPQQAGQYFNKIQCFCFEARGEAARRGPRHCVLPCLAFVALRHQEVDSRCPIMWCTPWATSSRSDLHAPLCCCAPAPACRSRSCGRGSASTCPSSSISTPSLPPTPR